MLGDELAHHFYALRIVAQINRHAVGPKQILRALERHIFADDNARNFIKQDGSGAHRAGRESCLNLPATTNIRRLPSGIFQAVHLAVMNHAALLHALIVAAPDNLSVTNEHRADRNAAFAQTALRFVDRRAQKSVFAHALAEDSFNRSATSAACKALTNSSRSPSITRSRLYRVNPMRWSVRRFWGKL